MPLAVSHDGSYLATGGDKETVVVWDVTKEKQIRELSHDGPVHWLRFHPNNSSLLATAQGDFNSSGDHVVSIWDISTGMQRRLIPELEKDLRLSGGFEALEFHPTGEYLLATRRHQLRIWRVSDWTEIEWPKDRGVKIFIKSHAFHLVRFHN